MSPLSPKEVRAYAFHADGCLEQATATLQFAGWDDLAERLAEIREIIASRSGLVIEAMNESETISH